jgi:hypothetical protein
VPRASYEADRREITCGLTNFVCADASVGPGTERRHYLAPTDCAAVASFGTVRTSHLMSDRLPEIRCWPPNGPPSQSICSISSGGAFASLPVFDYVSGSIICNAAVSSPSSFSASRHTVLAF